ncbi:transcriptional regulator, PadR-like family [Pseudobacteroides cellulosolvens ATCC 35603 = DSM 2933]|uniref:Transcriptional regulator, PadR-like family n=2 Tax=Pseudobacteroides cellulosolvens TaxID=35825 RepID=A0A0L6JQ95_9FIRM|nr:transcriptional regulator, PadR-like family [Pseudobacteroides cellulosolvens ATCC 35603 = DSM 2933]
MIMFIKVIDNYIGCRYNIVISGDGITQHEITEADIMGDRESIVLTEAVYYILLSLYKPMHGYGIMQNVMELSEGRVNLAAGTLYGAINTLLDKGFIKALSGDVNSRKKEYEITQIGKEIVKNEIERLRELVRNGERITGGKVNET